MNIKNKIEEILRNRVLEITEDYKGRKFKEGVQVSLGYPKLLIEELTDIFSQFLGEKIKEIEGLKDKEFYHRWEIMGWKGFYSKCQRCGREIEGDVPVPTGLADCIDDSEKNKTLSQVLSILEKVG